MAFNIKNIRFKSDSKGEVRMYCYNETCYHKSLGTTPNLLITHSVVVDHSRDVHNDPYPFD